MKDDYDGAEPSASSVSVMNLIVAVAPASTSRSGRIGSRGRCGCSAAARTDRPRSADDGGGALDIRRRIPSRSWLPGRPAAPKRYRPRPQRSYRPFHFVLTVGPGAPGNSRPLRRFSRPCTRQRPGRSLCLPRFRVPRARDHGRSSRRAVDQLTIDELTISEA